MIFGCGLGLLCMKALAEEAVIIMQWAYHGSQLVFPLSRTGRNALMLKYFWLQYAYYSKNVSKFGNTYSDKDS